MNRSERRRRAAVERRAANAELEARFREMHEAGQGCWEIEIVARGDALALGAAALAGDERSAALLLAAADVLKRVAAANPPLTCLTCNHEFVDLPAVVAFVTPLIDGPRAGIANGLCNRCARGDVRAAVFEYYKRNVISDARIITPLAQGGHA